MNFDHLGCAVAELRNSCSYPAADLSTVVYADSLSIVLDALERAREEITSRDAKLQRDVALLRETLSNLSIVIGLTEVMHAEERATVVDALKRAHAVLAATAPENKA